MLFLCILGLNHLNTQLCEVLCTVWHNCTVKQWQWLYLSALYLSLSSFYAGKWGGTDFFPCSSSSQNCPALYFVHHYTLLHIMHCFGAQVFQNPPFHTALNYRRNKIYSSDTNGISVIKYSYTGVYTVLFYLNNNIVAGENVRASREKSGNQRLANLPTTINMCTSFCVFSRVPYFVK
jgi:hypothetical protein